MGKASESMAWFGAMSKFLFRVLPHRFRVARMLASIPGQLETAEVQRSLRAELARWNWNWWDGSRASHLRDLDVLGSIVLAVRPLDDEHLESLDQLKAFVVEMRVFFNADSNFRTDGRMMPPAAARAFVELDTRLKTAQRRMS
jgi:hypothetical protein